MSFAETLPAGSAALVERPRGSAPVRRYPGAFWRLCGGEVRLVLGRRRNQMLIAVLCVVPVLIGIAVKVSTPTPGDGPPFLFDVSSNGLFLVLTALSVCIPLFLPLVVGVVSGDSIAGEAGVGTLRYLLTVPVTRGRLLAAKTVGVAVFTGTAVLSLALVGLVAGALLFGLGEVTLLSGDIVPLAEGFLRVLGVVAYVTVALLGLGAIGLFVSTLTENAIAAMATTVGISVFFFVLDAVPQLHAIQPALLTHQWLGFGELLRGAVDAGQLVTWSALHLAYVAVFLSLAWARLTTKDVTS